ncbi:MAG TPA: rhodanese-like domain-containing protein [Thermoanaerobaculia bacterium]|nr:rhodanese-like domain-containing protein [Thermoanaerobaculia bacterium]
MRLPIATWGLKPKLALAALLLGAVAVLGDPYGGGAVRIHPRELALEVHNEVDHVTAQQLAGWILAGRSDYRLIDLRDPQAYAAYHIPPAENIPLTGLPGDLARNEKIVLYSDGGIHSAQAWFLLKAEGYEASYILLGGLDDWNDQILNPTLPAKATPAQIAAFEKARQVSAYFGGTPRIASGEAAAATLAPVPSASAPPRAAAPAASAKPAPAAPKKKKEGC